MTEQWETYVITASDREGFKRCRRAWDFGARTRQNYEPIGPVRVFDFDRAIHEALAIYYFPGMWDWNRAIVLPLALEAFFSSMRKQRTAYVENHELSAEEEQEWNEHLELGERMLKRYSEWAPTVDRFSPIRVETKFEANIPDPWRPGHDLVALGAGLIRYQGKIELLVVDESNAYWLVDHRLAGRVWERLDQLLLDEQGISSCWAWEIFFLGMTIAGTIYNELRADASHCPRAHTEASLSVGENPDIEREGGPVAQHRRMDARAAHVPGPRVVQQGNELFRRTQISRSRAELENLRTHMALEALEMINPAIRLYPTPSRENCGGCAYRIPCIAMNEGSDVGSIMNTSYRKRVEKVEEGRLGGVTWSMGRGAAPPRFGR